MENIDKKFIDARGEVIVPVCKASELTEEEYALVRKDYFGASDSSILCGVNLYKKLEALIKEKQSKFVTDEEKEVGKKPVVMKGKDLEDLILSKFIKETGIDCHKPEYMYQHNEFTYLTTNFDGLTEEFIPVECKFVSRYGEKYYNKAACVTKEQEIVRRGDLQDHIKFWADRCGIPGYYYTQVQQQIYFADAPYGYLAALFDETWTFKVFIIPRDELVISNIISMGAKHAHKLKEEN